MGRVTATALLLLQLLGSSFPCHVVAVYDGDGPLHCTNGISVRLVAIQAPDYTGSAPCRAHRAFYRCDDVLAERARDKMSALVLGQTIDCTTVAHSYARVVASCTLGRDNLSCLAIAQGIATYWPRYDRDGAIATACKFP